MAESRKRILEMLAEKKITVDEAERLLAAIGSGEGTEEKSSDNAPDRKLPYKYLRVEVQPGPGGEGEHDANKVNIRVPMNLIRAGMKLTSLIPSNAADKVNEALKEKGIDFDMRNLKTGDIEELIEALGDLEVDVQDGREKVHVYVE
jgi:hypothetical protein